MASRLLLLELDRARKAEVGNLHEALAVEEQVAGLKTKNKRKINHKENQQKG